MFSISCEVLQILISLSHVLFEDVLMYSLILIIILPASTFRLGMCLRIILHKAAAHNLSVQGPGELQTAAAEQVRAAAGRRSGYWI